MRYVQQNTTIPVPTIRGYGQSEQLTRDSCTQQAFLIMDKLPGQSLQLQRLLASTEERRQHFYAALGNILAQLDTLRFIRPGYLMLDYGDSAKPLIESSLSIAENDLKINTGWSRTAPTKFNSASDAIEHYYHILADVFQVPMADASEETIKREIFAVYSLADQLSKMLDRDQKSGAFSLSHVDLRCQNILVDDDLHITGILDWEWAAVLPRQLCAPPSWITGHDPDSAGFLNKSIYPEFREAMETSEFERGCLSQWNQASLSIAQILRHPHHLLPIYYEYIYPNIYDRPFSQTAKKFFAVHDHDRVLQERLEASRLYTEFLLDRGLFVRDDLTQRLREILLESDKLNETLNLDRYK
ncbi:hypothetical protein ED733_004051 [Metarhizium rileyi]|uniref:Aminoglycoside phosphotransferase domain-containing protein n=1 Tax=Metarhizium rileyi (strain RCEF 4871) TaxID=1649241 RepID=A0A5C6G4L1_METRR|nr:hypothetical protein ED733_004051 [Metarhizium rileyi]